MKRLRYISVIVISIIFSQQFYGCRGCSQSGIRSRSESSPEKQAAAEFSNPGGTQDKQSSSSSVSLNELFNKYRPAVFMVLTSNGEQDYQATGFFITADGIAVSNYHVFEGTSRKNDLLKTADGIELQIERVLTHNKDDDFIIFKVKLNDRVKFTPIPIAQKNPEIGEDVFAIGNPLGFEHTLSKGIISGYRNGRSLLQTTAEITRGSSGGPLMNMKGEVVGITTAGMGEANLNFAVNIEALRLSSFLNTQKNNYQKNGRYEVFVSRVIDGDTFELSTGEKVRLIGIDAPEMGRSVQSRERLAEEATKYIRDLIEGKKVVIELDVQLYDRYRRLLAYVYVDTVFLNEMLLKKGLAVIMTYPPNVKHVESFKQFQDRAKRKGIGVWEYL